MFIVVQQVRRMTQKCRPPHRPRPGRQSRRKALHCPSDWPRQLGKKQLEVRKHAVWIRLQYVGAPALGPSGSAYAEHGVVSWSRSGLESRSSLGTGIGSREDGRGDGIFVRVLGPLTLSSFVEPAYPPPPEGSARRLCPTSGFDPLVGLSQRGL